MQGELTLEIDNEKYVINAGDAMRFNTDKDHVYRNEGNKILSFNLIFNWK